jgi:glutathione S-transferase
MGIPAYVKDQRIDLFRFVDLDLSAGIEYGFHAMSIDEMRADFPVTRWNDREKVLQQWFAGAHADVGGGYPSDQSGLSDVALSWLSERLSGAGVRFASPPVYEPAIDKFLQEIHSPWNNPPFNLLLKSPRDVLTTDTVDVSVRNRLASSAAYRPRALAGWLEANPLAR